MTKTSNMITESNKTCDNKNSCSQQSMRAFNNGHSIENNTLQSSGVLHPNADTQGMVTHQEGHFIEKKTLQCSGVVRNNIQPNAEAEAKEMAYQQNVAKQDAEQFANQKDQIRANINSIDSELKKVESEADKNAVTLAYLQHSHIKTEGKEKEKLDQAQQKVMEMAGELAQKQAISMEEERQKEEQLKAAEMEAHRLAKQKLELLSQQRIAAQLRADDLATKQAEARRKYNELSDRKEADTTAFNLQMDELKESEVTARRNADLLQKRQDEAQKELDTRQKELAELQQRAQTAGEALLNKRAHLEDLQRQVDQLVQDEADTRARAEQMERELTDQQLNIQRKQEEIANVKAEGKDSTFVLKQRIEERTTLETVSKNQLQSEEEAKRRAKELADRHGMDLKKAEEEIRKLMAEEESIREKESRLSQNANRQPTEVVEGVEKVTDVYQHTQIKTKDTQVKKEPHVTADGTIVTEEQTKGMFEKIGDAIGKIL